MVKGFIALADSIIDWISVVESFKIQFKNLFFSISTNKRNSQEDSKSQPIYKLVVIKLTLTHLVTDG